MYTLEKGVHTTVKERLTSSTMWVTGAVIGVLSLGLVIGVWSAVARPLQPAPSVGTAIPFKPVAFVSHAATAMQASAVVTSQAANNIDMMDTTSSIVVTSIPNTPITPTADNGMTYDPQVGGTGGGGGTSGTSDPSTGTTSGNESDDSSTNAGDDGAGTTPPADNSGDTTNSGDQGEGGVTVIIPPIVIDPLATTLTISVNL